MASKRRLRITVGILLLVLGLAVDAAYVAWKVGTEATLASREVRAGAQELQERRVGQARERFQTGLDAAKDADNADHHPAFFLGKVVPGISSNVRAVDALVDALVDSAEAGLEGTGAAGSLGITPDADPAAELYRGGQVQLAAIEEATPFLTRAEGHLVAAHDSLQESPRPSVALLRDRFDLALEEVTEARDRIGDAVAASTLLPDFLGSEGARRYFLGFQSLGEARGTGGLVGAYGVLEANAGKLSLERVGPIGELTEAFRGRIEAPDGYPPLDADLGGLRQYQQVNQSPHWPTASEGLLRMYEQTVGERLDGTIALDAVALSYLLEGMGALPAPELGTEITSSNAVDAISRDSYIELTEADQSLFLVRLIGDFWSRVESGELDSEAFAGGLDKALKENHLLIHSDDAEVAEGLARLDANGDFTDEGGNLQLVFGNNYSINKIDYYVHREIDTEVALDDARASVTTTVTIENRAPTSPLSPLIDPTYSREPVATSTSLLCVLAPQDAVLGVLKVDGKREEPLRNDQHGHPVYCGIVKTPHGETRKMTVEYSIESAPESLVLFPQTRLNPDAFSVSVTGGDEAVTSEGVLDRVQTIPLQP